MEAKKTCDNNCATCAIEARTYCAIITNKAVYAEIQTLTAAVVDLYNRVLSPENLSPKIGGENNGEKNQKQ